jgi:hypothetical protein
MIIVRIKGGLGNQLFQYSLGLQIARIRNEELYLDLSWFVNNKIDTRREFILDKFTSNYNIASESDLVPFLLETFYSRTYRKLVNLLVPTKFHKYIREREGKLNSEIIHNKRGVYFDGTWMSERYFDLVSHEIRLLFGARCVLNGYYSGIEEFMGNSNSVCVHVRRGDYAYNSRTMKYHGLLTLNYYQSAITYLNDRLSNLTFFFFSDDISWVRDSFGDLPNHVYVYSDDASRDIQEFYLMSRCNHFIIANSTFSWWTAWLGNYSDKTVCAPRRWSSQIKDSGKFLPENWKTL